MEAQLRRYVNEYGVSAVLELLMAICDEKAKDIKDDNILNRRYNKASVKCYQLSIAKFMRGL